MVLSCQFEKKFLPRQTYKNKKVKILTSYKQLQERKFSLIKNDLNTAYQCNWGKKYLQKKKFEVLSIYFDQKFQFNFGIKKHGWYQTTPFLHWKGVHLTSYTSSQKIPCFTPRTPRQELLLIGSPLKNSHAGVRSEGTELEGDFFLFRYFANLPQKWGGEGLRRQILKHKQRQTEWELNFQKKWKINLRKLSASLI